MLRRLLLIAVAAYIFAASAWVISAGVVRNTGQVELLNVACDPTRELWRDLNGRFIERYEQKTGFRVGVKQSHGGSASQANSIINGLDADVCTLALWNDTDAIRKAGLIEPNWEAKLANRSLPFVSTIVFVVRKNNPKNIHDWKDLARPGVGVITPSPATSGNGKWSFLAIWGSAVVRGGSEADAFDLVSKIYRNAPTQDASARAATMTFAQKKIGDVHLTWENEAHLEVAEAAGALEIVYPSVSVLAEPHVAVVDKVAERKGTRAVAEAYLEFLYTEEAQEVIAHHYYRPTNPAVKARTAERFPKIELFPVTVTAKDWDEVQSKFFAEGAIFDRASGGNKR